MKMIQLTLRSIALFICTFISMSITSQAGMDITAYEYQRKFHKTLSLGECPFRQVAFKWPNGTVDLYEERCSLNKKGVVRSLPRALSDTMNQLITSPNGVIVNLGLCGGEAASYLGILHEGECIAVEIASRLSFSDKTVVRAFVGYYRTSLDILDTPEMDIRDGFESYYKNKYYVKNRSYGILEIIFVQFRFWNSSQAAIAKNYTQSDPWMSTYMAGIKRRVGGDPKSVKIISLSTATEDSYTIKTEKQWNRALRYVQIMELQINTTRDMIQNNKIAAPHLKYKLYPFLPDDVVTTLRFSNPIIWEKTSMMEVSLQQAMVLVKKLTKRCKRNRETVCRRVRQFRRTLKVKLVEIHKGRSAWMSLTTTEKENFVSRYSPDVEMHASMAMRLKKDVKVMIREHKKAKLKKKVNRSFNLNEIPTMTSTGHRIRHARKKFGKKRNRKNQKDKKPRYRNMGFF